LPILLALATTVTGSVIAYQKYAAPIAHPDFPITLPVLVVATNLSLAALTIGRIWYTRHDLRTLGQTQFIRRYSTAINMLLESAAIYLLLSCIVIALTALLGGSVALGAAYALSMSLMNIIPVLLVVQVSLRNEDVTVTKGAKSSRKPICISM